VPAEVRWLEVPNFLDVDLAIRAAQYLTREMPEHWWSASIWPDPVTGMRSDIPVGPNGFAQLATYATYARTRMVTGEFSHLFYRTSPHVSACNCPVCEVVAALESAVTVERVSRLLGRVLSQSGGFFASRYLGGCFLSPHTDSDNGVAAAILSLTRNWLPQYGGLLHLLDDNWLCVRKSFTPTFNTLVLVDLPDGVGAPHFVSSVESGVTIPRVAVSGWYR
jgi:2-oxoglutarate-Fe(II)-dependent oxygenase superfamily protein